MLVSNRCESWIPMPESELLTVPEAAAALRLKPSTVRAWILDRRIPFCKIGRLVRIRRCDVEALLADSLVPVGAGDRP